MMKIYHDYRFTGTPPFSPMFQTRKLQNEVNSICIDYCKIQLNARNYAWNKRKHDKAQHSCVRHLGNALDKRDWRWHLTSAFSQRLRKYTFTAVHTKTHKRCFQIYPLWRAFSNLCVYGERFHRLRVDGRKKFSFTSVCVYNRLRVDGA